MSTVKELRAKARELKIPGRSHWKRKADVERGIAAFLASGGKTKTQHTIRSGSRRVHDRVKTRAEDKEPIITITCGDVAENHVGNQQIGRLVAKGHGFNKKDLDAAAEKFKKMGYKVEIIRLNDALKNIRIVPRGMKVEEVQYLKFNSRSKNGRALSNFADIMVRVNNRLYKSGEHAFQGEKYLAAAKNTQNSKRKDDLLAYARKFQGEDPEFKTAREAKKAGGKSGLRLTPDELEEWNKKTGERVQYDISRYKLRNSPEVKKTLNKYSDYVLLHQDNRAKESTPWSGRLKDGQIIGENKLGKIWMRLNEERSLKERKKSKTVKRPIDWENHNAYLMIVRNGLEALIGEGNTGRFFEQLVHLNWDKKYLDPNKYRVEITDGKEVRKRGRVLNKHARHNLCFSKNSQEPDYLEGKGRVVSYRSVPFFDKAMESLPKFFGEKAENLKAEGNKYYDKKKCGIGYHGDTERRKVIAWRLGEGNYGDPRGIMPLHYQWYVNRRPIGKNMKFDVHGGDIYIMSEKATGQDWKKTVKDGEYLPTLRHAAGSKKYTKVKK